MTHTNTRRRRARNIGTIAATFLLSAPAAAVFASGAATITVHDRFIDINPDSQNPCSGAAGTVVDINDIHFHVTTLTDGTINETGHNTATVTFVPDDPTQPTYEGHETYASSDSGNGTRLVITSTFHLRMKGTDGTFITLREVAHTTIGPNGVTSTFDKPLLTCT